MICAIHQPQYLPWPGYFSKLDAADVFVLYDNTQYKHDEWQNRNRIKTANGVQWLTVPVHHRQGEPIRHVRIDNTRPWRRKHAHAFATNYARAPFYADYAEALAEVYERDWTHLAELNIELVGRLCGWLGIATRTVRSSELDDTGRATDALVSICRALGADVYLSGPGGRGYLEPEKFGPAGIELRFHDYEPPEYAQPFGAFLPGLSAVDVLLNCGPASLDVIRSGRSIGDA
jgi:hypothetical protein